MAIKRTPILKKSGSPVDKSRVSNKSPVDKSRVTKRRDTRDRTKLRPSTTPDSRVRHGACSLDKLLKADLNKRLKIVRERDLLESQLVDYAGGPSALTPSITLLIKRITHKSLVAAQAEKAALLGRFDLSNKTYLALANSLRLDLAAFEAMLRQRKPKALQTLDEYLDQTYGVDSE